jgi:probable phosphoglycerate mutase
MAEGYQQRLYTVPDDATEVILVRHGASAAAVPGEPHELLEGRGNPALSDVGHQQAEAVGARLASEPIAAIFTSTLIRTHETAAPLVARTGLTPTELADLAEVNLGPEYEGGEFRIRIQEGDQALLRALATQRWDALPNGEPAGEFSGRVRRAVDAIVAAVGPGAIAVAFTHGGVIAELCRQATDSRGFAFIRNDNTSISRLVVHADRGLLLRSFNDIGHLA